MPTDEDLLAEWRKAGGDRDGLMKPHEQAVIVRNLRSVFEERQRPLAPLEYCILCGTKARGHHHESLKLNQGKPCGPNTTSGC